MVALKQLKSSTSEHTKKPHTKVKNQVKTAPQKSDYLKSLSDKKGMESGAIVLRGIRKKEGLTQAEFAVKIGLSKNQRNNISLMENGHRPISKKTAQAVGNIFNIDYRLLL